MSFRQSHHLAHGGVFEAGKLKILGFHSFQETVVTEYLNSGNANEAVNGVREMRAPKHFLPEMLSKVIILSLDRSDEDKEKASSLISLLKQEGIATSDNFMQVEHFLIL